MSASATASDDLTVPVPLGPRSYDVHVTSSGPGTFGSFARTALGATWAGKTCRRALVVTDENVARLARPYLEALDQVGIAPTLAQVIPGEASKSLEHASDLLDRLVAMRADRHTCVVAIGGGVVGDLAGFVAATYARGLPLLMVPTSLLAQVDSSVGGKVGINHPRAKNIIGAFHQPVGVWIDTTTLASLPPRELRCGLAEVIKYGVILDSTLFDLLEQNVEPILALDPALIRRLVARSCELKAEVVSQDEREETGVRSVLNFGHTIGHAIEAVAGYGGPFQHGEAVAVGMVGASRLAEGLGWIPAETTRRITALIRAFGLPTAAPGLDPDALLEAMSRDKKVQAGVVRFVLPRQIGRVEMTDALGLAEVRQAVLALTK